MNWEDVKGMNIIILDCYCISTYVKNSCSFLCLLPLHVSSKVQDISKCSMSLAFVFPVILSYCTLIALSLLISQKLPSMSMQIVLAYRRRRIA